MKKIIFVFNIITILLLITSCKTTKLINQNSTNSIPGKYLESKDSLNSVTINWKNYFSDTLLVGLIDTAIKNNYDLLMAQQRIEVMRAELKMRKGDLLPLLSVGGTFGQTKFGQYTMDGAGNKNTDIVQGKTIPVHLPDYYLGLQTAWEIDVWGKLKNRKKAALLRFMASEEYRHMFISNLIAEVASAYFELISLDNELDIIRETIKLEEYALNIVKIQKEAAVANALAVNQFEAQVKNVKAMEIEVEQKIKTVENKINFLLARYPQKVNRNKLFFINAIKTKVNSGIPSELLVNRPDIRKSELELQAFNADVAAAKASFFPSFVINGTLGFQAFNPSYFFETPQSIAYTVIGNLIAPLVNRNAIKSQFKAAKAQQVEALYKYQQTILNAYVEVNNELSLINTLQKIAELKIDEVNILSNSIDISSELFKTGKANYLEVLLMQQNTLKSKLELVNVKKQQCYTFINIYKALGGGWK